MTQRGQAGAAKMQAGPQWDAEPATMPIPVTAMERVARSLEREVAVWPPTPEQLRAGVRLPSLAEVAHRPRPVGFARQMWHGQWLGAWEKAGAPSFPHVAHSVLTLLTAPSRAGVAGRAGGGPAQAVGRGLGVSRR